VHLFGFLFIVVIADARNHEPETVNRLKISGNFKAFLHIAGRINIILPFM
jgi:hypothetical protein